MVIVIVIIRSGGEGAGEPLFDWKVLERFFWSLLRIFIFALHLRMGILILDLNVLDKDIIMESEVTSKKMWSCNLLWVGCSTRWWHPWLGDDKDQTMTILLTMMIVHNFARVGFEDGSDHKYEIFSPQNVIEIFAGNFLATESDSRLVWRSGCGLSHENFVSIFLFNWWSS